MTAQQLKAQELYRLMQDGDTSLVVIDVRNRERYEAGHVPGARHIPVQQLEEALPHLPKDGLIVTY